VNVRENDIVSPAVILGRIGRAGTDNDHLHLAVYEGTNTSRGLVSRLVNFVPNSLWIRMPSSLQITAGQSQQLTASAEIRHALRDWSETYSLNDAAVYDNTWWVSSNRSIVTVGGSGNLRGVANGSATITLYHGGTKASTSVTVGTTSTPSSDRWSLRVYNCDDSGRARLNGTTVVATGFGQDSGFRDITANLRAGANEVTFEVVNNGGAITYGFQVARNGSVVFQQACGTAYVVGCENNRTFPTGVARTFKYEIRR
jgi:hypothetical protein